MESIRPHALIEDELKQVCDWVVNYRQQVAKLRVMSSLEPGAIMAQLPDAAPSAGESLDQVLQDLDEVILPGITHWQHPQFFGYFPANASWASIYGEVLAAGLGVQGMSWITSPAATELELKVMQWLRQFWGLPDEFCGVIQDSASAATTVAMLAARERVTQGQTNITGIQGQTLVAYCSEEAHSSIEKAARLLGIGSANLRKIAVDEHHSMRAEDLEGTIIADLEQGLRPFFVVGCFGTTATCGIDPLAKITHLAGRYGLWCHIDAAYAGSSLCLPHVRELATGIADADSLVVNPHKWLLTHFDCSAFFTRHPAAIKDSLNLTPEYLKTNSDDADLNLRDWGLGLGRRFRALKLWLVLRLYGTDALAALMQNQIGMAAQLAERISQHSDFELMAEPRFNLVCFRYHPSSLSDEEQLNELNRFLLAALNESGRLFMTHTVVNGAYTLRMVIGQTNVRWSDIEEAWETIRSQASYCQNKTPSTSRS